MKLTADQIAQLQQMRADIALSEPPFRPSEHWRDAVANFDKWFREFGVANPEEQNYNMHFSGFRPGDLRLHRYVTWMYKRLLERRDTLGLLKKIRATCKEGVGFGYHMEGCYLSLDLMLAIDDFYNLLELNPGIADQPLRVLELGAGWGKIGFVLRQANPNICYIDLDLPEVLTVAQSYLPTLLPQSRVRDYAASRGTGMLDRRSLGESDLWFMGPQDMLRIGTGQIDIVVNTASFQEMPVPYVKAYLEHFDRVAAGGHCYLRQLWHGAAHQHRFDEISGFDAYPIPTTWPRNFLRNSNLSDEFFEAGFSIPARQA